MAKDLYQNNRKNEKNDFSERSRRIKKGEKHIICIAALGLVLAACGTPSGSVFLSVPPEFEGQSLCEGSNGIRAYSAECAVGR